jgi:acetylornithine/succinyldiaminopimelate/putrescine aminotransferase
MMMEALLPEPGAKESIIDLGARFVCPGRVETFRRMGTIPVMARREGNYFWDLDGRRLFDVHINGGTYNLGHRNPEVIEALREATAHYDIGNHHLVSTPRARLAESLARLVPGDMQYSVITPSGAEAVDVAIRSARHATGRRKIVSFQGSYHGHGGLSLGAGYAEQARFFLSGHPEDEMVQVPFNDLARLEEALVDGKAAAVLCEMIPATMGFRMPSDGYYPVVRRLCDESGTAFIADEVQTGLGRTGRFWACEGYDVAPDILVTGKGLSGGIYPIAAAVHTPAMAGWMKEDGWGYSSTFGGSELGCAVALKVLEMIERPGVLENVSAMSSRLARGLDEIQKEHPFLVEIRQNGLVIGLRFDHAVGGALMAASGYESGLWAFPAGFDQSVLQFKPNLLIDEAACDEAMQLLENAIELCERRL